MQEIFHLAKIGQHFRKGFLQLSSCILKQCWSPCIYKYCWSLLRKNHFLKNNLSLYLALCLWKGLICCGFILWVTACLINPGVSISLWHDLFSTNKIFYSSIFLHLGPSFQPNVGGHMGVYVFSCMYVLQFGFLDMLCVVSLDVFLDFMCELGGLFMSKLF